MGYDRRNRFGVCDPEIWNLIRRALTQQKRLSSIVSPGKKVGSTRKKRPPSIPSRTSSQRRTLDHFAKELEKYAKVTGAAGKLPIFTPTESDEQYSLQTVRPLLPFQDEFEIAGLAVTSEQQRKMSPVGIDGRLAPRKLSLQHHCGQAPHQRDLDGQYDEPKVNTDSSSGSVVVFTPPGESPITWAKPLPVPPKGSGVQVRRKLPWLRRGKPAEVKVIQPRQRVGTMIEVSRGEWKLADDRKESTTQPDFRARQPRLQKGGWLHPEKDVPPVPPDKPRPTFIRPHVAEYVKNLPPEPARRARMNKRDAPRFRHRRDLAQGDLPQLTPTKEKKDSPRRGHGHHPPEQHSRGCPIGWIEQAHDATVNCREKSPPPPPNVSSLAPELPYTWKLAVSDTSSLEQALHAASQRMDKLDSQEVGASKFGPDKSRNQQLPTSFGDRKAGHQHHPLLSTEACQKRPDFQPPLMPLEPNLTTGKVKTSTQDCRHEERRQAPSPQKENAAGNGRKLPQPKHQLPPKPAEPVIRAAKVMPPEALQKTLSDLDVFFDSDDATVNDRDVLKGLQVAVRAAADDLYDALIRNRTGLRIRRFLADLKSIDTFDAELAVNQPARQRRAEKRKLARVNARRSAAQSGEGRPAT
ncbi:uncharacterized protein JN550_008228 [Neoarthrinium moseri]|uniref:uncharacterized protein n=1 Tax=Neoarthrinium moseri TaxID=1658444 RepID=UPI001FDC027F|nr:uncharacterized protein JN550_008228 [Neoarthrinium moseri]KAI1865471.1 hypothetical protein JN550_008228 [Neoarthrinium moseri]